MEVGELIVELTVPAGVGVGVGGTVAVVLCFVTVLSAMSTKKLTAIVALLVAPWKRTHMYDRVLEILKIVHNVQPPGPTKNDDAEP